MLRIEKLRRDHDVAAFDCGKEALNRFLNRYALQSQSANATQTYLGIEDADIVGFYSLVFASVEFDDAPERLRKGVARHPVPVMLLTRLAVSRHRAGKGIGSALLRDALLRTVEAATIAGLRAFAVHAMDDEARGFYLHFDFLPSPTDPMHLFVLLKDVKTLLSG